MSPTAAAAIGRLIGRVLTLAIAAFLLAHGLDVSYERALALAFGADLVISMKREVA